MTLILKITLSILVVILFQRVASVPPGTSRKDGIQTELEDGSSESWERMNSFNRRIAQDAIGFPDWDERDGESSLEVDEYLYSSSEEEFLLDSEWTRQDAGIGPRRWPLSKYNDIDDVNYFIWPIEEIPSEDEVSVASESSNQNGCIPNQLIWPCECSTSDRGEVSITCRNAQGPDLIHRALIPNYPRANMQILNIAKSNIEILPKDILHGKTFEEMNLYGSGIQGIEEGAFDGCHDTLRIIRLNTNHLQSFNFSQLLDFPNLQMIGLGGNQITSLENIVGLPTLPLTILYIGRNNIKSLPTDVFVPLEHLAVLDLSYNDITFIPEGIFLPLKELQSIYLQGNKLGHISTGAFWFSTPILRSLDIRKLAARTTDTDIFRGVGLDTKVDFDLNHMKHLSEETFEPLLRNVSTKYGWFSILGSWLVCDCDVLWILEDESLLSHLFSANCNNWTALDRLNYDVLAEECAPQTTTTILWEEESDDDFVL